MFLSKLLVNIWGIGQKRTFHCVSTSVKLFRKETLERAIEDCVKTC